MKRSNFRHPWQEDQYRSFLVLVRDERYEQLHQFVIDLLFIDDLQALPSGLAVLGIHITRLLSNLAHRRTFERLLNGFAKRRPASAATSSHLKNPPAAALLDAERELAIGLTHVARGFDSVL